MRHFAIRKGDKPSKDGAPLQRVTDSKPAQSVGYLGFDAAGLRPAFEVKIGDRVELGQTLFRDRRHPEIAHVSSVAGTVEDIAFGARRTLSACVITVDPGATARPTVPIDGPLRETLLACGLWPAFRTRPFGRTPAPQAQPSAIFVNATQASPQAPDPAVVLDGQTTAFEHGLSLLTRLTEGTVFLCQSPGTVLHVAIDRVEDACFRGTRAAGLDGTHIDCLHPIGPDREVWSIGYQDVAAIGHLFQTGQYRPDRVVALVGPTVTQPRLIRTVLGANLIDICTGETEGRIGQIFSGDLKTGRPARFLGRFDNTVAIKADEGLPPRKPWLHRHLAAPSALIPTASLDRALAVNIPAVPLMRALSVCDTEAAERLGCLALVEEDVAALSQCCTSGADYGALLRQVLEDLMGQRR